MIKDSKSRLRPPPIIRVRTDVLSRKMLALDYSQILPLSPANLGKVASAGKNLDRVQEFSSELTNLCEKLNVGLVSSLRLTVRLKGPL